ncbi:TonB-dependent receptor [Panacibacter sp. DH6]|uniref:TonB-dependent receptor n=2 Tax=Panacibacter microcysteis TaxID=2793269 RepID=A0A931GYC7_9BACT|nr:TonB-dependent receptor [Panacibacter microcysteis]
MKLMVVMVFICSLQASADGFGQQKISLKLKKTQITDVLVSIEKQTNYRFLYNNDLLDLKQKVSLNVQDAELKQVLDRLFAETALSYELMQNNLIVIKETADGTNEVKAVIKGKITGENNAPLSGVSVMVKGTNRGTTTDAQGNFSITVESTDVLVISYVGYESQEIAVADKVEINVVLKGLNQTLTDVVVIGYGTASKRDLTGSIVKVDGKVVADKPNTNPVASLQGRVAGLSVVNNGTPGRAPDIRIRGTVSIGQVSPLYVVDGIFNDNIDYLNPNDIESIEVLKDPSSLAIFGVKGATGVIAITTKKGKAGQVSINFNTTYGIKKLTDKIQFVDGEGFKTLFAEERANDGVTDPFDYTGLNANTDWIDAVSQTGNFNTNNLSLSVSSDKNRFNLGVGYIKDEGIVRHEELQRWVISLSDEVKLTKNIKVGVIFNGTRQNNPYDATSVLDDARKVIPLVSADTKPFLVKNPYGTDSILTDIYSGLDVGLQSSGVVNPLLRVENEWNTVRNIEYRTVGSIYAEVTFLRKFTFRSTLYGDISNIDKRQYTPLYYAYNPRNDQPYLYSQLTKIQQNNDSYRKWQQDHVLNYKTNFGDHNLTLTGGFTTYYFGYFGRQGNSGQNGVDGTPIPNDPRFWYITSGFENSAGTSSRSSQSEYSTVSYLGRALYNYKGKYYLNASFRNDASSRLPANNRDQQFWAVGAAWELSKEAFMANQKIFDYIKLKGSVGVLGNQTASRLDGTPLNYPFYPNLLTGTNAVFGTNVYSAARQEYLPNPDLKWETVSAWEAGVELNAFDNRLHFEANYFNRTTNDLMTFVDRSTLGLPNKLVNGGSLRNWGEEFTASWNQQFSKDLTLNVSGNITFLKNKVLKLSDDLPNGFLSRAFQNNGSAESRTVPGQPIGSFYGYIVEGIYQSVTEISKSPDASSVGGGLGPNGSPVPGDFKFKDVNGDGIISALDRTFIGNPTPDFTYGASINLTYKGFNLGIDVVGVYGNEIFRTWGSLESPFQRVNYSAEKLDRWNGPGTSNWVPIIAQSHRNNYNGSTYNIEDGSYFRIRNLQLGYNFDQRMLSKIKVKNLRIFANVQNLKTFKNNLGYTTEYGGDATAFGYDNAGGAIPVVSTVGLNVTF